MQCKSKQCKGCQDKSDVILIIAMPAFTLYVKFMHIIFNYKKPK